jgi:HK97 family phage major capsid protein
LETPSEIETKANREWARAWLQQDPDGVDHANASRARKLYAKAFNKWARRGTNALTPEETKTLSVGSGPDGGFYVEPARGNRIIAKLFETSELRPYASVIEISTSSVKFPIDRDEASFGWVGEQTARPTTTTPQVGELEIPAHEMYAMPAATQNILDDSAINVEEWLNGKIADKFGRVENSAFVVGNGASQPKGFLTYPTAATPDTAGTRPFGTIERINTGVSGAFPAFVAGTTLPSDILLTLIYSFKAGYRKALRFGMTRTTLAVIRKMKDGQSNYIAGPRLSEDGLIDEIFSFPVSEFADMPELGAGSLSVALADWARAYQIVDRLGLRQVRDIYTDKPRVLFYTTKRVGGAVVDSDAIKLIQFS